MASCSRGTEFPRISWRANHWKTCVKTAIRHSNKPNNGYSQINQFLPGRLMTESRPIWRLYLCLTMLCSFVGSVGAKDVDSRHAKALFKNPPREYSTGPLWVWNDLVTEEEIQSTLRDLASQEVKQAWVHPRPGLMTPYLSADWFYLWQLALREARKLDMNIWIYDENSYPSGFAGGFVPEVMPESRGRGLVFHESNIAPKPSPDLIGVYQIKNGT